MAEGKKSFILYLTQRPTFEGLSDEDAGKLIKTIFAYVSDENPQPSGIINYAFQIIKPVLKADLVKYEDKRTKLKENISKRWNKNENKDIQKNTNEYKSIQNDSVIVIDNDIVIDNVNEVSKDTNNNNILSISKDISNITSEPRELALELPTISGNKGNSYPIYQDQIDHWQSIYLGVDVYAELNKMLAWLEANPKNKKTYQGTPKFIVNWLSRQQDRASRNGTPVLTRSSVDDNGGFEEL